MKKLLFVLMFLSTGAFANSSYFGLSLAEVNYSDDTDNFILPSFFARIGTEFTNVISGEIRYGYGVSDDYTTVNEEKLDQEMKGFYGAYLKVGYPLNDKVSPYYIIGITKAETAKTNILAETLTVSETDNSMGFGADISISNSSYFNIEYMTYIDHNTANAETRGLSLGIVSKF